VVVVVDGIVDGIGIGIVLVVLRRAA